MSEFSCSCSKSGFVMTLVFIAFVNYDLIIILGGVCSVIACRVNFMLHHRIIHFQVSNWERSTRDKPYLLLFLLEKQRMSSIVQFVKECVVYDFGVLM